MYNVIIIEFELVMFILYVGNECCAIEGSIVTLFCLIGKYSKII